MFPTVKSFNRRWRSFKKIYRLRSNYIRELNKLNTIEEISYWTINILQDFTDQAFNFDDAGHSNLIEKAIAYINEHYNKHITLDKVAHLLHLSSSYFSSLFKGNRS